jgi:hypothetical protein
VKDPALLTVIRWSDEAGAIARLCARGGVPLYGMPRGFLVRPFSLGMRQRNWCEMGKALAICFVMLTLVGCETEN